MVEKKVFGLKWISGAYKEPFKVGGSFCDFLFHLNCTNCTKMQNME